MRLSGLVVDGVTVVRDGEFSSIGTATEGKDKVLVLMEREEDAPALHGNAKVACAITRKELADKVPGRLGLLVCEKPLEDLYRIHNSLARAGGFYPAPKDSIVSPDATVRPGAHIDPKGVTVGPGCVIHPRAVLLEGTVLDEDVVIGPGTVVGISASMAYPEGGRLVPVVSAGGVHIARKVEVHACCTISRAVFGGRTEIGEYTMFDNLVSVGANASIGKRCFLPACAAVGRDAAIGHDVWVGPNAVVSDGVTVGDGAHVTIGSVVVDDVQPGKKVTGNFAVDHDMFIRFIKKIR